MNVYLKNKKEEVLLQLQMVMGNDYNWILEELKVIEDENNYTYELIPFVEFLNSLALESIELEQGKIYDWWNIYSKTLEYSGESLKNIVHNLCTDLSESYNLNIKNNVLIRIKMWIKSLFTTK